MMKSWTNSSEDERGKHLLEIFLEVEPRRLGHFHFGLLCQRRLGIYFAHSN